MFEILFDMGFIHNSLNSLAVRSAGFRAVTFRAARTVTKAVSFDIKLLKDS